MIKDLGMGEIMNRRYGNLPKAKEMMRALGIPYSGDYWSHICVVDLYDIFMDEEKLKTLVSKLRNRAFW